MKTLEQLNTIENNYIRQCGGVCTEGDWKQNTISRNKARAMKRQYGKCFLGKINLYNKTDTILKEYNRGMIYNFGADFILPEYNAEIENMIKEYNNQPYSSKIIQDIKKIINKIESLNGINLLWV
jgi:hypothetical protein